MRALSDAARRSGSSRAPAEPGFALALALAACGGDPGTPPDAAERAFDITSSTVVLTPTLVKDQMISVAVHVAGNADAFPGPDQVPIAGELFLAVDDPSPLEGGALTGDLPGDPPQPYQLTSVILPALVSYLWYLPDPACSPGCARDSTITMRLADNTFGGSAPPQVTIRIAFSATLHGWQLDADSPKTTAPAITLAVQ